MLEDNTNLEQPCLATVYSPDPQDCGTRAYGTINGVPLCSTHYDAWLWAEVHEEF